jgi:hypothetical protein
VLKDEGKARAAFEAADIGSDVELAFHAPGGMKFRLRDSRMPGRSEV